MKILLAVFSKCLPVGVALQRISVESDVSYNLGGLGKSLASPSFRNILTFQSLGNAFSSLFRQEKFLIVLCYLLGLTC